MSWLHVSSSELRVSSLNVERPTTVTKHGSISAVGSFHRRSQEASCVYIFRSVVSIVSPSSSHEIERTSETRSISSSSAPTPTWPQYFPPSAFAVLPRTLHLCNRLIRMYLHPWIVPGWCSCLYKPLHKINSTDQLRSREFILSIARLIAPNPIDQHHDLEGTLITSTYSPCGEVRHVEGVRNLRPHDCSRVLRTPQHL